MFEFLLNISLGVGLLIFVPISVSFGLSIYLIFHYIIKSKLRKNHQNMGRMLFRVAASLLSLILSLTFANQRVNYFKLKSSLETEASLLFDIKVDLDLFDTKEAYEIQTKLKDYVFFIAEDGWKSLYENPFNSRPFVLFREIYLDIDHLESKTPLQERLKENLLDDIDLMSDYLQVRLYSIKPESNHLIYTSIFGLLVNMILFAIYPPDKITIGFLSLYVAFLSVVFYFILMMSTPLRGPLQIEPAPFLMLKETIEANSLV